MHTYVISLCKKVIGYYTNLFHKRQLNKCFRLLVIKHSPDYRTHNFRKLNTSPFKNNFGTLENKQYCNIIHFVSCILDRVSSMYIKTIIKM